MCGESSLGCDTAELMAACSDSNLQGDENSASELNTFNLGRGHELLMITLEQRHRQEVWLP